MQIQCNAPTGTPGAMKIDDSIASNKQQVSNVPISNIILILRLVFVRPPLTANIRDILSIQPSIDNNRISIKISIYFLVCGLWASVQQPRLGYSAQEAAQQRENTCLYRVRQRILQVFLSNGRFCLPISIYFSVLRSRSRKKITFTAPAPVIIQKKHFHNQQIFQNMITNSGFF